MKSDFLIEKTKKTEGVIDGELSVEYMQLDLSSLKSTKTFIEQYKASGKKLNVLICNAGIAYVPLGLNILIVELIQMFSTFLVSCKIIKGESFRIFIIRGKV